ncbi:MAG: hypothetical protein IKA61_03300 [Clostridia bacterium]|nr:hypothetical protein [Clostridia bacterium]
MKRIFIVLLAFALVLYAVGCNVNPAQSEPDEPLVEMQEIEPADTVNLSDELSVFSKILDNNYINAEAKVNYEGQDYGVTVNAKRTEKGYDAIVTVVQEATGSIAKIYFIGGKEYRGISENGEEFSFIKTSDMYWTDRVSLWNKQINAQLETKIIYHVLKPIVHKFKGFENTAINLNYTQTANGLIKLLSEYRTKSIYDFVVGGLMGIDVSDVEANAKIKEDILAFCSGNPSVAVFIDRIEEYINTNLVGENKINIKEYLNAFQQTSGISTEELVELLRDRMPSVADNLRAVEEGETFYDYLRSYLRVISLNAFATNVLKTEKTFVEYVSEAIEESKGIETEYAINYFVSKYFAGMTDENGELVIGAYVENLLVKQIVFTDISMSFNADVDAEGRPSRILASASVKYAMTKNNEAVLISENISVDASINYSKTDLVFEIPQEVLDNLI